MRRGLKIISSIKFTLIPKIDLYTESSEKYTLPMQNLGGSKSELFIGLVAATGTDLGRIQTVLDQVLTEYDYKLQPIKFSDFFSHQYFQKLNLKIDSASPFNEIYSQMEAGNKVRKHYKSPSLLAKYAVQMVKSYRGKTPAATAYLFRSLKNPEESKLLRETYGVGYYQIGVFSPEEDRIQFLDNKRGIKKSEAYELIEKDISEESAYGQQTRDTFQLSDFFLKFDAQDDKAIREQLVRALDLIFGNPHITPTFDEHMMYMAYSFSVRSADLSRQVGAVLVNAHGDVIGLGSNDVPRSGGGPYWPTPPEEDWRDFRLGYDPNEKSKNQIVLNVMKKFKSGPDPDLLSEGLKILEETGLTDITEFNRATHAEMSAILSSTRIGATTRDGTIYCTTFPCHNCAKHIVEAGIKRTLFVEPYPKSQAGNLHGDAISLNQLSSGEVTFEHFIGVAARRYLDLFSMKLGMGHQLKRKLRGSGAVTVFDRKSANVRVPLVVSSYLEKETLITSDLSNGGVI